jgi:DNA polymerase-3 subunit epsilon
MHVLIYDTETSGLPLFSQPSEDPGQPHLCEIAALLFDSTTRELQCTFHHLVRQDGWEVEPKAFEAHGITPERSFAEGIDEATAVRGFYALQARADVRVAHNEMFDQRILRIGLKRYLEAHDEAARDALCDMFKLRPAYCTMKAAQPLVNLPATEAMRKSGRGSWKKPPSLAETYQHFFGAMFEGAHGALADAKACARIYFHLTQGVDIGSPVEIQGGLL